jgi:hypothetical protein
LLKKSVEISIAKFTHGHRHGAETGKRTKSDRDRYKNWQRQGHGQQGHRRDRDRT